MFPVSILNLLAHIKTNVAINLVKLLLNINGRGLYFALFKQIIYPIWPKVY